MDKDLQQGSYRPAYRMMTIGKHQYAVLDQKLAAEKAQHYLNIALNLLETDDSAILDANETHVNNALLSATDFGSAEAAYLLGIRILDGFVTDFSPQDALGFLNVASERGAADAMYLLGCSYAGMGMHAGLEDVLRPYLNTIPKHQRESFAIEYLRNAVEHQHFSAIQDLIMAFAYGRGCIRKNADEFVELCIDQANAGNQSVALGFGAWLAGMTVDGNEPLAEAVKIPTDFDMSLDYLLLASRGDDVSLGQHALQLICKGFINSPWGIRQKLKYLRDRLYADSLNGNQLLSLYIGWYSIPQNKRPTLPPLIRNCVLPELEQVIEVDEKQAITNLDIAFCGYDKEISSSADFLYTSVLGWYRDAHVEKIMKRMKSMEINGASSR